MSTTTVLQKQANTSFVKPNKMMETRPFDYVYGNLVKQVLIYFDINLIFIKKKLFNNKR